MSILNIKDLCKNFGEVQVLRHVNMNVDAGEFVAVMGQSEAENLRFSTVSAVWIIPLPEQFAFRAMNLRE